MKGILKIRKLVWLINSVLLIIIIYIVLGFFLGGDAKKNTSAFPIPTKDKREIIPFKHTSALGNHKIIMERNIFGSSGSYAQQENAEHRSSVIREQFRLCATVAGDDQVACAVIEDLRSRQQGIYKTGEFIEGARIERINRNKIILIYKGQPEVLDLHVAREVIAPIDKDEGPVMAQKQSPAKSANVVLPIKREINKKTFATQVPAIEVFLEKVEVAPYVINGQQEGFSITGVDDLEITKYLGLEDGDVIQNINGQMLTDKQKAFQVLQKARALPSLDFQLLRNQRKKHLSFEIQ